MAGKRRDLMSVALTTAALVLAVFIGGLVGPGTERSRSATASWFGPNGRVLTNLAQLPAIDQVSRAAIDSQGRVLIAGLSPYAPSTFTVVRLLPDGSLDTSFANRGRLTPGFGASIDVAPDDSLFVVGTVGRASRETDVALRKFTPDGLIDRSFGDSGTVRTDLGFQDTGQSVSAQPDGDLLVVGEASCGRGGLACGTLPTRDVLLRYNAAGDLLDSRAPLDWIHSATSDPGGGFAILGTRLITEDDYFTVLMRLRPNLSKTLDVEYPPHGASTPTALAVQSDGRLVLMLEDDSIIRLEADNRTPDPSFAGTAPDCPDSPRYSVGGNLAAMADGRVLTFGNCGIARLGTDGTPDPTFGSGGIASFDRLNWRLKARVESDGQILAASPGDEPGRMRAYRLDSDGRPVAGFGENGLAEVNTTTPTSDEVAAVAGDSRGRLVVGGRLRCLTGDCAGFALVRYFRNGSVDATFGRHGRVITLDRGVDSIASLATYPDDSIVAVGDGHTRPGQGSGSPNAIALAKYLPNGRLDPAFGDDGVVLDRFGVPPKRRSGVQAVALQRDRKVVVAGWADGCGVRRVCLLVVRYLANGRLDRSFAHNGVLRRTVPGLTDMTAEAIAIQRNGRIVLTGSARGGRGVTVRLRRDGKFDRWFGQGGVVVTSGGATYPRVKDVGIYPNAVVVDGRGRITIGAGGRKGLGALLRFLPNGRTDRRFGRRGVVRIPRLGITDLALAKCGLFVSGTFGPGWPAMGLAALRPNGPRSGMIKRVRTPFGRSFNSYGVDLLPTDRRRSVTIVGTFARGPEAGDFALAKFRTTRLIRDCGR